MSQDVQVLLLQLLQAMANTMAADWRTETGFPKVKQIRGVSYLLQAPLHPDWFPTATDMVFSGQFGSGGEQLLADPSNGDGAAHPWRSAAGYPLHYAKLGAEFSYRLPPRVLYDGQTHESDAEVEDYKRRVAQWIANNAANDAALRSLRWSGPVPASTLREADWDYYVDHWKAAAWHEVIDGHWMTEIAPRIQEAELRRADSSGYQGVLAHYVAQAA